MPLGDRVLSPRDQVIQLQIPAATGGDKHPAVGREGESRNARAGPIKVVRKRRVDRSQSSISGEDTAEAAKVAPSGETPAPRGHEYRPTSDEYHGAPTSRILTSPLQCEIARLAPSVEHAIQPTPVDERNWWIGE